MKVKNSKVINNRLDDQLYKVHIDDLNEREYNTNSLGRILDIKRRKLCKEQDHFDSSKWRKLFTQSEAIIVEDDEISLLDELLEFDEQNYEE